MIEGSLQGIPTHYLLLGGACLVSWLAAGVVEAMARLEIRRNQPELSTEIGNPYIWFFLPIKLHWLYDIESYPRKFIARVESPDTVRKLRMAIVFRTAGWIFFLVIFLEIFLGLSKA